MKYQPFISGNIPLLSVYLGCTLVKCFDIASNTKIRVARVMSHEFMFPSNTVLIFYS